MIFWCTFTQWNNYCHHLLHSFLFHGHESPEIHYLSTFQEYTATLLTTASMLYVTYLEWIHPTRPLLCTLGAPSSHLSHPLPLVTAILPSASMNSAILDVTYMWDHFLLCLVHFFSFSTFFIVVQVQLSPFSPHNSAPPKPSPPPHLGPTPFWFCPCVVHFSQHCALQIHPQCHKWQGYFLKGWITSQCLCVCAHHNFFIHSSISRLFLYLCHHE